MNTPAEERIELRFRQGSSDKVYQIELKQKGQAGWVVNFAYGRYGKPLKSGTKTRQPIPYEDAKKAFNKLRDAKANKGYYADPNNPSAPVIDPEAPKPTGWLPQLLNPVEDDQLSALWDDWAPYVMVQIKHDGERRGILLQGDNIIGANRRGLTVPIREDIRHQLEILRRLMSFDCVLDCEDMGDHLVIFDVILDGSPETFNDRRQGLLWLWDMVDRHSLDRLEVDVPLRMKSYETLRHFIEEARDNKEEGVVLRHAMSFYTPGRPNSGGEALKHKFYESATCIVESLHPTKRSIGLALLNEVGEPQFMGNCTVPPNYELPRFGNLVEIKYLYANQGGSIYQPQYKGVRNDLDRSAATLDQLKWKE